jgi:ferric-dicitrate binding protein FerR (iron transport regulator)
MKTDKHNQAYHKALARYLSVEMGEAETQVFEKEITSSGENKLMIEKMKKQWSALEGCQESQVPDTHKAWDKLHGRLTGEKLIPAQASKAKAPFGSYLLKAVAFMFILLGVAAIIYMNTNRNAAKEMVRLNTGIEANTLIKTLDDGSVIYIAQHSLFSFPSEFENTSRNVELKGEAFFDIAPNPDKPFIIETEEALIEVLGTAFNVKTQDGTSFELIVDRGKVKVTLKKNPAHSELVVAGEKITAVKENLVKTKHSDVQATSWYKKRMHFKDESLQNIINVLNRNFNTKFVVAERETGNRKLTVTFHNETELTMTELICVTLNLKSQTINGSVVLSENKEGAQ